MNNAIEEWEGSKPCKFKGSIKINTQWYKDNVDLYRVNSESKIIGLEKVKTKRHFPSQKSGVLPD